MDGNQFCYIPKMEFTLLSYIPGKIYVARQHKMFLPSRTSKTYKAPKGRKKTSTYGVSRYLIIHNNGTKQLRYVLNMESMDLPFSNDRF
jgi:hypothetical protein